MGAQEYLDAIKLALATSELVTEAHILQERVLENTGFFRARLRLRNDDFLEISEYFNINRGTVQTVQYRYQWMDSNRRNLRKRWDNAPHHPELTNFPHHVHIGNDTQVEPGQLMGIIVFIEMLEHEINALP